MFIIKEQSNMKEGVPHHPVGRKGTFDGRRLSKVLLRYFRRK